MVYVATCVPGVQAGQEVQHIALGGEKGDLWVRGGAKDGCPVRLRTVGCRQPACTVPAFAAKPVLVEASLVLMAMYAQAACTSLCVRHAQ